MATRKTPFRQVTKDHKGATSVGNAKFRQRPTWERQLNPSKSCQILRTRLQEENAKVAGQTGESPLRIDFDEKDIKQFRNKLAPFWTMEKPTCGVRFSRETDNKKKKMDIEPSNLVRWRRKF